MPTYIGIDPGKSGGIAVIREQRESEQVDLFPMPSTEAGIYETILEVFHQADKPIRVYALIEKVHSMPKQGVASSFTFGMGYGGLRMALTAIGIPFEEIPPRTWMKFLNLPIRRKTEDRKQWKLRLKARAQQLFPAVRQLITLETADALLIAECCRRRHSR